MENYLFWSAIFESPINVISNSCFIILNFIQEKNRIWYWNTIHCNLSFHNKIIDKIINCIYLDLNFKLTCNKYLSIFNHLCLKNIIINEIGHFNNHLIYFFFINVHHSVYFNRLWVIHFTMKIDKYVTSLIDCAIYNFACNF